MAKIKSRQRMGYISLAIHWTLILCTCGLWYPIYASRRRARSAVTYMPAGGIPVNVQQQPQQPYPPQQWTPPRR